MNWTRSETLALANQHCSLCYGLGMRPGRGLTEKPCHCVFRAIFRACYARFKQCHDHGGQICRAASLEFCHSRSGLTRKNIWSMKSEEFIADFELISRRVLGQDTLAHRLFRYHFLLGADWKLCCRRLNMERGEFFHEVYRIQQRLGRAFRECRPYALFPIDEYFGGVNAGRLREPESQPLERLRSPQSAAAA